MVVENLPLVGYLVAQVCAGATHLSRDDLAQAGAVGLVKAATSYDASRGVPFGAYARERILGAIRDEMRSTDWAKRTTRTAINQANATREVLLATLGREPTVEDLANALGVDRATAAESLSFASRSVSSLDSGIADFLVSDDELPEEQLIVAERLHYLKSAVASLPERMRYIVVEMYFHDRTVGDLAEELGVTHSAISQQRSEAIALLRSGMATYDPDALSGAGGKVSTARASAFMAAFSQTLATGKSSLQVAAPMTNPLAGFG
jgi:RNA polymerase sigma factor for flagellar operon FliA